MATCVAALVRSFKQLGQCIVCGLCPIMCIMPLLISISNATNLSVGWPTYPVRWPEWWYKEVISSRHDPPELFLNSMAVITHSTVLAGGLIASKGSALFFSSRHDLDLFLAHDRGWYFGVHFMRPGRMMMALTPVYMMNDGGLVFDEEFGVGYVLWQEYVDDWHFPQEFGMQNYSSKTTMLRPHTFPHKEQHCQDTSKWKHALISSSELSLPFCRDF